MLIDKLRNFYMPDGNLIELPIGVYIANIQETPTGKTFFVVLSRKKYPKINKLKFSIDVGSRLFDWSFDPVKKYLLDLGYTFPMEAFTSSKFNLKYISIGSQSIEVRIPSLGRYEYLRISCPRPADVRGTSAAIKAALRIRCLGSHAKKIKKDAFDNI